MNAATPTAKPQPPAASTSASASADLADHFARHAVATRYETVPPAAIEAARASTLDTLGCMLGATGFVPSLRSLVELFRESGGREESTVIGFGGRLPAWLAAFANGAMAHCLDYDDHIPEGHHPSSSVVPALFALAERQGGVNGRDFLAAVALGQDIFARLRRNVDWKQDWHLTPVLGAYASTVACSRLLGLTREQTVNSIGIATCQSAGTMELGYGVGSDLRGMYAAFSAKAGVFSSLLAQRGVTGVQSAFDGRAGVMAVYFGGRWNREAALKDLGHDFHGASVMYKPWPSCGASHVYIDAALRLLKTHQLATQDVKKLVVHVGDFAQRLCEPIEGRRRPATVLDAKFSIPYTVALAVARRKVGLPDFTEAALRDPEVLGMADRIDFVTDPQYDWKMHLPGGAVTLETADGRRFSAECLSENVRGSAAAPLTWGDLVEKFAECSSVSVAPLTAAKAQQLQTLLRQAEALPDVSPIIRLLG